MLKQIASPEYDNILSSYELLLKIQSISESESPTWFQYNKLAGKLTELQSSVKISAEELSSINDALDALKARLPAIETSQEAYYKTYPSAAYLELLVMAQNASKSEP